MPVSVRFALLAIALSSAPLPALAGDGRVEINQARALAGGVTAGDAPGFPVHIYTPGSYLLAGNLTVTALNTAAVSVQVDDVSIDLNGFAIIGPATCFGSGSALTCSAGVGVGIEAPGQTRIGIRNGRVHGFASTGVLTGERAEIRDLVVDSNGSSGVSTGPRSRVHHVTADRNRGVGISISFASLVDASVVSSNFSHGISGTAANTTLGCVAYDNGGNGINGSHATVVRDSSAYLNEGDGIGVGFGALVSDSSAYQNGSDGISTGIGSTVQRSTARVNAGFGLNLGGNATYRENTIDANGDGTVTGSGVNMGSNSCDGATTCP